MPLRFSVQIPTAPDLSTWTGKVRRAESSGFYSVSVPDHLGPSLPQLAPLVALAAASPVTSTLRLAITVLNNDLRHPVMTAKEVATLDVLSGGRVDLGLGAGWLEEDYAPTTGVARWDPAGVRVERLAESVGLLRRLLAPGSEEAVTFRGRHYSVEGYRPSPTPVQDPIPLLIGARGRRMLGLAAREAQIVSILAGPGDGGRGQAGFEQQLAWIEEAGGRTRPDLSVGLRIPFGRVCRPGQSSSSAARETGAPLGMTAEEVIASPFFLVGDVSAARDQLVETTERYDISYITLSESTAWPLADVVAELSH